MVRRNFTIIAQSLGTAVKDIEEVSTVYPFAITPFLARRVEEGTYSPQALRQFAPDRQELNDVEGFYSDPTDERSIRPVPAILRAYENRVLMLLSNRCLVHCRFCFRKAFVGFPEHAISDEQVNEAIAYVAAHPEIEEVILSGGDPLSLPNHRLIPILQKITQIRHVKIIRIDSRALSTVPARIDDELIAFLKAYDCFAFHAHMNHPDDINHREVTAAVRRLRFAGVSVHNQCVILAGVNDESDTMSTLMVSCYYNGVEPYNMYILDHVKGAAHFKVSNERIIDICMALSHLPGPAQPTLVYVDEHCQKHRTACGNIEALHAFLKEHDAFLERVAKKPL